MRYRRLQGFLHAHGLYQEDVADLLGISVSSVSRRYRAIEPWRVDEMYALLDAVEAPYSQMSVLFPRGGIESDLSDLRKRA